MRTELKFSTGIWVFGPPKDRFCPVGYRDARPLEERFEQASQVRGLKGIEFHYPSEVSEENVDSTKKLLAKFDLKPVFVAPGLFGEPKWKMGSLCSTDDKIRSEAIERAKAAVDTAKKLGAPMVVIWPGQDGYDYPFQVNYLAIWNRFINAVKEIAAYDPKMKVALEYKPFDPRSHILIDSVGKTLAIIQEIGLENLGINIEIAHAQMAGESLAESVCLMSRYKRLFHTHFNDSFAMYDNDLIVGSVNFLETLEMVFWLQEVGYSGWFGLDLFPAREDPVVAVQHSIDNINLMVTLLDRVDRKELKEGLQRGDIAKTQTILRKMLISRGTS